MTAMSRPDLRSVPQADGSTAVFAMPSADAPIGRSAFRYRESAGPFARTYRPKRTKPGSATKIRTGWLGKPRPADALPAGGSPTILPGDLQPGP